MINTGTANTSNDDEALQDLASEMRYSEVIRFIRDETGLGIKECHSYVENIAKKFPKSKLGMYIERIK